MKCIVTDRLIVNAVSVSSKAWRASLLLSVIFVEGLLALIHLSARYS